MSNNRFDFPEVHGEWLWGRTQVRYGGTTRVELAPSLTEIPPRLTEPKLHDESLALNNVTLALEAGLSKKVDMFIKMPLANSPTVFGIKYQVCGNMFDKRKRGDIAGAFTLAAGYGRKDTETTLDGVLMRIRGTSYALDGAFILGYRLTRDLMVYGGPYYSTVTAEGQIIQNGTGYDYTGHGRQGGANLGMIHSFEAQSIAVEMAVVDLKWSYGLEQQKHHFGLAYSKEF